MGLNRNKTVVTIVRESVGVLHTQHNTNFASIGCLVRVLFHRGLPSPAMEPSGRANVYQAFTQTALKQLQVEWEKRQKEPSQGEEPPA